MSGYAVTQRARLVGGLVAAVVAAPIGAAIAAIFRYAPVWPFVVLAVASAALAGLLLGPTIARARRHGWLAMAAATYLLGVLLYPLVSLLVGDMSAAPGSGPTPLVRGLGGLLGAYLLAPVGVMLAAPFAPGVLMGAFLAELAVKHLAPLPALSDAEQQRVSRIAGWSAGCLVVVAILGFCAVAWYASRPGY